MAGTHTARRRQKFSEEPRIQGPKARRTVRPRDVETSGTADWYLILKQVEHNGVAYLPLNHHLVEQGAVPERVPSNGAKGNQVGQNTVPVDVSGRMDTFSMKPSEVFALYKCGAIAPVDPAKSHARLMEGRRMSKTVVPAMIPPVKRVANLRQQYQQATAIPMTVEGMQNLQIARATLPNPF